MNLVGTIEVNMNPLNVLPAKDYDIFRARIHIKRFLEWVSFSSISEPKHKSVRSLIIETLF